MKHYTVVAAIIRNEGEILCVQRKPHKYGYISLKYEFPGGKVEAGESEEDALIREIREELEIDIEIEKEFLTVDHEYPDFRITMHSFLCQSATRHVHLKEHVHCEWLEEKDLAKLDWAGADIPIVDKLKTLAVHGSVPQ